MSDDKILMPRKLTEENGAKAALICEFFVEQIIDCPDCDFRSGIADDEVCECCNDVGTVTQRLPVTWTTIKAIYEKAVRTLGQPATSTAQAGEGGE